MEDNNTTPLLPSKGLEIALHGMGTCADIDLVVPNNVTTIYEHAFDGANIKSLYIPKSVTTINESAFWSCNQLETIEIAKDNPIYHSANNCIIETSTKTLIQGIANSIIPTDGSVEHIGNGAFMFQAKLTIDIPFGVKSIENGAFAFSRLQHISIPTSVKKIDSSVFHFCNLHEIMFKGTTQQWYAIEKGENWQGRPISHQKNKFIVYCNDGKLTICQKNLND